MNSITRKIAVAGVLSAVTIVLGLTRLGFLPWFGGGSITIMHVPPIIAAILEGPLVGAIVGALFGLFSLLQAAAAPNGPIDVAFTNPLISILPRLLIGPAAYLVYRLVRGRAEKLLWRELSGVLVGSLAGSLTNTVLVLSGLGIFGFFPWPMIAATAVANGPLEAGAAALLSVFIVSAWKRLGDGQTARLAKEEDDQNVASH